MGPTTYALCRKSIIGPAMWIAGLCSIPPLVDDVPLPLDTAGASVTASFSAPVDKRYQFLLSFEFPSTEARLRDAVVGQSYREECDSAPASLAGNPAYGRPIPVRIVVRRAADSSVVLDQEITSLCTLGHTRIRKMRSAGLVTLERGEYTAEVVNVAAQEGLANVRTYIALVAGTGK